MKKVGQKIIYSPSDLLTFFNSPFASWMDRYFLEHPDKLKPDKPNEQAQFIINLGNKHEKDVLNELEDQKFGVAKIEGRDINNAREKTLVAFLNKTPVIYQAFLEHENFAGFADFVMLNDRNEYQVWDTKLAFSLKPTYVIQLCYYYEALKNIKAIPLSNKIGVIFGTKEKEEYSVEDFFYFYLHLKEEFLKMQDSFTFDFKDRPEPLRRVDHGRWDSSAKNFFQEIDHLSKIASISTSQIKKLKDVGIKTMKSVANLTNTKKIKIEKNKLEKIVTQAKLQVKTEEKRKENPLATPEFIVLKEEECKGGLNTLPSETTEDVFFDMEGYPLMHGGLEYLFGASVKNKKTGNLDFYDWWAHSREEEKIALEEFIDWAYKRWQKNKEMHIYHYASYEVTAIRRLSTMHNTRQDEIDDLLRNEVFIDLYKVIKNGIMIGTESYSIKDVELLYRPKRDTSVASGSDSIVQYAQWIASGESKDPGLSKILSDIRSYNKDDCDSTAELVDFLRKIAKENNIETGKIIEKEAEKVEENEDIKKEIEERKELEKTLYQKKNETALFLADIIDFHRREEKTKWWRMFDLAEATENELYDDMDCIARVKSIGTPSPLKQSYLQKYQFNSLQECKISNNKKSIMMFTGNLDIKFTADYINTSKGELVLKISKKKLEEGFDGVFPKYGSLIPYEHIPSKSMQESLMNTCREYLEGKINKTTLSIINRDKIENINKLKKYSGYEKLLQISDIIENKCVLVQGPPGTGKTYTASHTIANLLKQGKKIGISSNSHKAIDNLLEAVIDVLNNEKIKLEGVRVGGDTESNTLKEKSSLLFLKSSSQAKENYKGGVVAGTSWLFSRPEWRKALDFLFIDEAGQVSLANTIAVSPCANNIVLLGDQMQLKQPIQGSHPRDANLSGLQYTLKDILHSTPDKPVFHSVVPDEYGIFLNESRRMHPNVCSFISESIYERRLLSYNDCAHQKIKINKSDKNIITKENGILFVNVNHTGNTRKSEEEAEKILQVYKELIGKEYTSSEKTIRLLKLEDFLFIAPYNAQVALLKSKLPKTAKVGTIDKFQGQEAPVCIISLCMSYGEERERGLSFVLDKNRINVAISRTQCLAVVVGDKRIANNKAKSIDNIKQINLFCKLITY